MTTLNEPTWTPEPTNTRSTGGSVGSLLGDSIARVRTRLLMLGLLRWTGTLVGLLAAFILIDLWLHLSIPPRVVMLAAMVWIGVVLYRKWIMTARRVDPSPSDMALNITRSGGTPTATIAAIVDLPTSTNSDRIEQALTSAIQSRVSRHLDQSSARATLRTGPMYEMLAVLLGLLLIAALTIRTPSLATIGVPRIVTPWTQIQWPKRFGITLGEFSEHHPSDRAFIARATIGPSTSDPSAKVRWRLVGPGRVTRETIIGWTALTLNPQGSSKRALSTSGNESSATRYEQLIPIHTLTASSIPDGSTLEFRIETRDDRTATQRVTIVHPPKLEQVLATVTLPGYASSIDQPSSTYVQGTRELSPSALALGPVLAGSTVTLDWAFDTDVRESSLAGALAGSIQTIHTPEENSTVSIIPVDAHGFAPRTPTDVFIRVIKDSPPDATITLPSADLVVGQRALIEIDARASDDLGLVETSIIASLPPSSDQPDLVLIQTSFSSAELVANIRSSLDLEGIEITPGQSIELRALAIDINEQDSQSPPRTVRIVEDTEIVERVETQLGTISEILRRLDDRQRELQQQIQDGQPIDPNDQRALTDQIQTRIDAARSLAQRLTQSRINDGQLTPMLEALEESLTGAQDASQVATESIEREDTERAQERMDDVRDELARAISMLDRGQDTWLAKRSIEELRSKVQALLEDTKSLGNQTGGKSVDQLSEDDRSMLQKILDKQRRVTQDARETIDQLDEQADALDENNPTGAQGIRDAATQGRNSGIEEQLAQAGEEIAQNQTSSAAATQEQVLEELDKMLEQIEEAQKNRDSALRRKLASIMDSLAAIIEDQTSELARLDQGEADLDESMIIVRGNTLSVRDEAAAAFPETQSIAESLSRATDSQSQAIVALRAIPADFGSARQSELAALTHLQTALDEAKRQDEQAADRQAQQLREQLRKDYQEAFAEQTRISTETEPLAGQDLNRRQRAAARQLGTDEAALRSTLSTMLSETEELSESPVFELAHEQLDQLMESAIESLSERSLDPMIITDQQGIATILTALIEVLGESQQSRDQAFEDGQGGDGGGQGGGGQQPVIPPMAQLQLLRSLQQLTATQTRALSESDAPDPARLDQIGRLQRQLAEKGAQLIQDMNPQRPQNEQSIEPGSSESPEPAEEPSP